LDENSQKLSSALSKFFALYPSNSGTRTIVSDLDLIDGVLRVEKCGVKIIGLGVKAFAYDSIVKAGV
jgi:hypothetical protein